MQPLEIVHVTRVRAYTWRDWPRPHQVAVWVAVELQSLREIGLIAGGRVHPTEEALGIHAEMLDEGFAPTDDEVFGALATLEAR